MVVVVLAAVVIAFPYAKQWVEEKPARETKHEYPTTEELNKMSNSERREFLTHQANEVIEKERSKTDPDEERIAFWQKIKKKVKSETATVKVN
jgi:hypothetical protein